jgi:hypothetical protein
MARETCVYCGAALSEGVREEALLAAKRVLGTKTLADLEAAATGQASALSPRRYIVIDTTATSVEAIAEACEVSVWEARQWKAATRYRLVKVTSDPPEHSMESRLKEHGLSVHVVPEETVARARTPVRLEAIDAAGLPVGCTLRNDPEAPSVRRELKEEDLVLVISASIRREKLKEPISPKKAPDVRLEDAFLVHLHLRGETRPWEIDPRRTAFEGAGLASAHMTTLALVRRLSATVPHDEGFKNQVPAMAPGLDPLSELVGLKETGAKAPREQGLVVLDNVSQFREYSAWRGAIAMADTGRLR